MIYGPNLQVDEISRPCCSSQLPDKPVQDHRERPCKDRLRHHQASVNGQRQHLAAATNNLKMEKQALVLATIDEVCRT